MSDLNVVTPSSAYTGARQESIIDETVKPHAVQPNIDSMVNEVDNVEATGDKDVQEGKAELTPKEMTETLDEMNGFLQDMKRNLSFSLDEQSGQSVIIVKDSETEEVIRQIPSEELVVLRKKMDDLTGLLFDTKV